MNDIVFTLEKTFTAREVQELFLSVNWISGKYPQRLYKALMGSSTVVTARHGDLLVGLARAVDDGELLAYIHYVAKDKILVLKDGKRLFKSQPGFAYYLHVEELVPDELQKAAAQQGLQEYIIVSEYLRMPERLLLPFPGVVPVYVVSAYNQTGLSCSSHHR